MKPKKVIASSNTLPVRNDLRLVHIIDSRVNWLLWYEPVGSKKYQFGGVFDEGGEEVAKSLLATFDVSFCNPVLYLFLTFDIFTSCTKRAPGAHAERKRQTVLTDTEKLPSTEKNKGFCQRLRK